MRLNGPEIASAVSLMNFTIELSVVDVAAQHHQHRAEREDRGQDAEDDADEPGAALTGPGLAVLNVAPGR